MGKSGKTGKARQDKFYSLAKETGYRSRASFKLLQLNRKFEFLEKSRVVIDLCAAPGGWLQVAANSCAVSSIIIGIDLVPIGPIHNVTTFQEDITTESCRQVIKRELQTWKADCVLHDGSPNVGKSWIQDAFQQSHLALSSLKLAAEFLKKGGSFVTKVFRSKDYPNLIWVFKQLFRKVHATKPEASRNESAEIYVVCLGYLAPDKVDPRLLDPDVVFQEKPTSTTVPNLLRGKIKEKVNRGGYADDAHVLFNSLKASEFISTKNHMQVLSEASEILLDEDWIRDHRLTTNEIKECCKDVKLLGRTELRVVVKWRNSLAKELRKRLKISTQDEPDREPPPTPQAAEPEPDSKKHDVDEDGFNVEKRKKKKVLRQQAKLRERKKYDMDIPGDQVEQTDDIDLFNIGKIKTTVKNTTLSLIPDELKPDDDSDDYDDEPEQTVPDERMEADETDDAPADDSFEIVSTTPVAAEHMDPVELALCSEMISSKKRKGEITDTAYNRYAFNDVGLPEWFVEDERKHMKPMVPVSREKILEYKEGVGNGSFGFRFE